MKTLTGLLAVVLMLISCKKEQEVSVDAEASNFPAIAQPEFECFEFTTDRDTVTLKISHHGGEVGGDLVYDWFERDGNIGSISGGFSGDTLMADYTFQSEGMTSVREIVFVRKGNTMIQGNGDMEEKNGIVVFKDKSKLSFDNSIVLTQAECN